MKNFFIVGLMVIFMFGVFGEEQKTVEHEVVRELKSKPGEADGPDMPFTPKPNCNCDCNCKVPKYILPNEVQKQCCCTCDCSITPGNVYPSIPPIISPPNLMPNIPPTSSLPPGLIPPTPIETILPVPTASFTRKPSRTKPSRERPTPSPTPIEGTTEPTESTPTASITRRPTKQRPQRPSKGPSAAETEAPTESTPTASITRRPSTEEGSKIPTGWWSRPPV